jgi:hypothetical protein
MSAKVDVAPPALGLTVEKACAALGIGYDFWRDHVEHEIRIVRRGKRKIVPVSELQKWLDKNAEAIQ